MTYSPWYIHQWANRLKQMSEHHLPELDWKDAWELGEILTELADEAFGVEK